MDEKFGIRVRCASCTLEGILPSKEDKDAPLLFNDVESAFRHVSHLGKKTVRVGRMLDRAMGVDDNGDTTYECDHCQAISRIRDLTLTVFRYL